MDNKVCIFCVIFNQFLVHSRSEKTNLARGGWGDGTGCFFISQ